MFSETNLKYLKELRDSLKPIAYTQHIGALDTAICVLGQSNAILKSSKKKSG